MTVPGIFYGSFWELTGSEFGKYSKSGVSDSKDKEKQKDWQLIMK